MLQEPAPGPVELRSTDSRGRLSLQQRSTFSILPAFHICSCGRSFLHVLDHLGPVMLIDAGRRVDVADVTVRLANTEIEAAAVVRIGGRVHEVL